MKVSGIAILVVVLGLTALATFELTGKDTSSPSDPVAVRTGTKASDFSIKLFSGQDFRLAEQKGHVTVVNFWASWCPPCREEAPALERMWQNYKSRGIAFVGINEWDAESDAKAFLQNYNITYPTGPDTTGEIAIDYGVTGLPETWFLAPDGHLVRRWIGAMTERQANSFVEEALK